MRAGVASAAAPKDLLDVTLRSIVGNEKALPIALFALALATFAIGATEFVIVGLIPDIAQSLGASLSTAGLLVSLYALAITLGTPVFSALTSQYPRRPLIIGLALPR